MKNVLEITRKEKRERKTHTHIEKAILTLLNC